MIPYALHFTASSSSKEVLKFPLNNKFRKTKLFLQDLIIHKSEKIAMFSFARNILCCKANPLFFSFFDERKSPSILSACLDSVIGDCFSSLPSITTGFRAARLPKTNQVNLLHHPSWRQLTLKSTKTHCKLGYRILRISKLNDVNAATG